MKRLYCFQTDFPSQSETFPLHSMLKRPRKFLNIGGPKYEEALLCGQFLTHYYYLPFLLTISITLTAGIFLAGQRKFTNFKELPADS